MRELFVFWRRPTAREILWLAILFLLPFPGISQSIILNEIMFDPDTLEYYCEYIELKNTTVDSVSLNGWYVGNTAEVDELVPVDGTGDIVIPPNGLLLIMDPGYFENAPDIYNLGSDSNVVICVISDNSFGRYGLSNSKNDTIFLRNPGGKNVDSCVYTCDNQPGFSEERMSDDDTAWGNSIVFRGTPGRKNSIAKPDYDIQIRKIWYTDAQWHITLQNVGFENVTMPLNIKGGVDENQDQHLNQSEIQVSQSFQAFFLSAGDSLDVSLPAEIEFCGEIPFIFVIEIEDDNPLNNSMECVVTVPILPQEVLINEIMFDADQEGEWVEIFNAGTRKINLQNLIYYDLNDSTRLPFLFLEPGEYGVVCEKTAYEQLLHLSGISVRKMAWLTLNNDKELLGIADSSGHIIDEAYYEKNLIRPPAEKGRSIERINPNVSGKDIYNWTSSHSVDGATPGRKNSVYSMDAAAEKKSGVVITPNPFSPDGDGFRDQTQIAIHTDFELVNGSAKIFDLQGTLRQEWHLTNMPGHFSLWWDGTGIRNEQLPLGIYVFVLELVNRRDGRKLFLKKTLVLTYKN